MINMNESKTETAYDTLGWIIKQLRDNEELNNFGLLRIKTKAIMDLFYNHYLKYTINPILDMENNSFYCLVFSTEIDDPIKRVKLKLKKDIDKLFLGIDNEMFIIMFIINQTGINESFSITYLIEKISKTYTMLRNAYKFEEVEIGSEYSEWIPPKTFLTKTKSSKKIYRLVKK